MSNKSTTNKHLTHSQFFIISNSAVMSNLIYTPFKGTGTCLEKILKDELVGCWRSDMFFNVPYGLSLKSAHRFMYQRLDANRWYYLKM